MSILEHSVALGKIIAQTDEYQGLQAAEQALRQNREARQLVQEIQDLQKTYERIQMLGNQLTQKNLDKLNELEQKATAHPVVKAFQDAGGRFYAVMDQVNGKIWEGITGREIEVDYGAGAGEASPDKTANP